MRAGLGPISGLLRHVLLRLVTRRAVTCAWAEAARLRIGAELRLRAAAVAEAEKALAAAEAAAAAGDKSSAVVRICACSARVFDACLWAVGSGRVLVQTADTRYSPAHSRSLGCISGLSGAASRSRTRAQPRVYLGAVPPHSTPPRLV